MNFMLGRITMSAIRHNYSYAMKVPVKRARRKPIRSGARMARYVISLPERVVRSAAALAGGLIREIGDVSVPSAVRRTKTYQMMVDIALRFMIEQVGEVKGVYPSGGELASDFLLRRTAGHGIELAGLLAFRASPVWIMAALADVSGAGRHIVQEIADALKQEGLLAARREIRKRRSAFGRAGANRQPGGRSVQCAATGCSRSCAGNGARSAKLWQKFPPRNLPSVGFLASALGGVESRGRGAKPSGVRVVVDDGGFGDCARSGDAVETGARRQSRRLAIRTDAGRKRSAPLQPGVGRHPRTRLRGVLGAGVSALSARGRRSVFAQAPVADGALAEEGDSVGHILGSSEQAAITWLLAALLAISASAAVPVARARTGGASSAIVWIAHDGAEQSVEIAIRRATRAARPAVLLKYEPPAKAGILQRRSTSVLHLLFDSPHLEEERRALPCANSGEIYFVIRLGPSH